MSTHADRVVIGYDGTAEAILALDWAADEAARRQVPLSVVFAADMSGLVGGLFRPFPSTSVGVVGWQPPTEAEVAPGRWHRVEEAAGQVAAEGAQRARDRHTGLDVEPAAVPGSAKAVLVDASRRAALLVTGTRGRGALAGCLVGSVASTVSAHAHCPVVVVREDPVHEGPTQPVVVGVDGSEPSKAALRFAAARASKAGAPLRVVCAWSPAANHVWSGLFWQSVSTHGDPDAAAREAAEAVAAESVAQVLAEAPGLQVTTHVADGEPAGVILAEARDAGLVVVGARGRGSFAGLVLGSVSHNVVHDAPCPVAVIRIPEVPPDGHDVPDAAAVRVG